MDPLRSRYAPRSELSLRLTLSPLSQGGTDPAVRRDADGWWLALRVATGLATLLLRQRTDAVEAYAWGDGAEAAIDAVPRLLGADDDDDGFDPRCHPVVAELHHRTPGLRLVRTGRILAHLVPTVLAQKVTALEAKSAWRELVARHGDPAPGPAPLGMRVPPSAAAWRRIPSWEWHRAGVGPQRSDTLMRVFAVADSLERAASVDSGETGRRLRTIPGIGAWTVAEVVQRSHGDPDAVSVGDLHVSKRVGAALVGRRVDDAEMMELLEPWRGHRQRVVRLVEASGVGYERHGPRMAIPEHRRR
jgi:3-methyladenine DNA glycosylase/8-oxoguanine DNA glycosylase